MALGLAVAPRAADAHIFRNFAHSRSRIYSERHMVPAVPTIKIVFAVKMRLRDFLKIVEIPTLCPH